MRMRGGQRRARWRPAALALAVASLVAGNVLVAGPANAVGPIRVPAHCPWVAESLNHRATPERLANEVIAHMTLAQKANFVVLATYPPLENANIGVPALCIPPLTLTDGPNGVANGLQFVTQLPAAIGVGATFDPTIARSVATVLADEARAKGIDGVQGPELNLARIPVSGRIFETYGEDPYLSGILGVAAVRGIQSQGEIADAKHFTAYTQETARLRIDQRVPLRALAELYNLPFQYVVQQAHVASLMCSYGSLNGVNTCSDPYIYRQLRSWGFTGFVRSDLRAVVSPIVALRNGISLVKPASSLAVLDAVRRHALSLSDLDRAVRSILVPMFQLGLIAHPLRLNLYAHVSTPTNVSVALNAAEQSIVLLKNSGAILPLASPHSVAVIGASGAVQPVTAGGGSAAVVAGSVVTPLKGIRAAFPRAKVTYVSGQPTVVDLGALTDITVEAGVPLRYITKIKPKGAAGKSDVAIVSGANVTPATATATRPGSGKGWTSWSVTFRAKRSGDYEIAFEEFGDTWVTLNGRTILASPGLHARTVMSTTVHLSRGVSYTLGAKWFTVHAHPAPQFDILDVSPDIARAVAAARRARVAIVVAGAPSQEGADRTSLSLPGDLNDLIQAVAAANPRTVVVLQTGGAVTMPWLSSVAGVVEAWFPGQVDGTAVAAVLSGKVDPAGRLPITFPASFGSSPAALPSSWPGHDALVNFGSGLDVGYRWYQAHQVTPLFPFGFGLTYTSFSLSQGSVTPGTKQVRVSVRVTNTGSRAGTEVVQTYVAYPTSTGEPPEQLRAFARVTLAPGASRTVTMVIPRHGFEIYRNGTFTVVPGTYGVNVGDSSANLPIQMSVNF